MGVATSFANLARATGLNVGIAIATIVVTLGITSMGVEPDIGVFREEGAIPDPRLVHGFVAGLSNTYFVAVGIIAAAGLLIVAGMPRRRRPSGALSQRERVGGEGGGRRGRPTSPEPAGPCISQPGRRSKGRGKP